MESFIWLAIALAMGLVEALSLTLVTIWFVIGGLAAFLAAKAGASLAVQIVVFVAVSLACLLLFRPMALRYRKHGEAHEPTPVGQQAVVVERIDPATQTGRVETPDHMTWSAESADGNAIEAGTGVSVVDQRSIKLIVKAVKA